jgi:hypothetical protein
MDHWYCRECRTARPEKQMLRGWNGLWCPNCVWDEVVLVSVAAECAAPGGASAVGARLPSGRLTDRPGNATAAQGGSPSPAARRVTTSGRRKARARERVIGTLAGAARRREIAALALTVTASVRNSTQRRRAVQAEGGSEGVEEA